MFGMTWSTWWVSMNFCKWWRAISWIPGKKKTYFTNSDFPEKYGGFPLLNPLFWREISSVVFSVAMKFDQVGWLQITRHSKNGGGFHCFTTSIHRKLIVGFNPPLKIWIKLTLFKKRADLEIDSKRKTKSNAWIHQLDSNTKKLRNCLSQIPSQRRLYIVYSIQQTDIGVSMRFVWPDILDYSSTSSTLKLLRSHNHLQAQAIQNISPTKNRLVKVLEL